MAFRSVSDTQTPPTSPPRSPPSPQPPMMTAASFYLKPEAATVIPSLYQFPFAGGFRWNTSLRTYTPSYSGFNPFLHPGSFSAENTSSSSFLRFGSSPSLAENPSSSSVLRFGLSPSLAENPSSSTVLRFGSSPSFAENLSSRPVFRFGSSPNREENKNSSSVLLPGSPPDRDENRENFSGLNRTENDADNEGPVEPESESEEGEELEGKGKEKLCVKLPVKAKGSEENSDDSDGEGDGEADGDGEGDGEADGDGDDEEEEEDEAETECSFECEEPCLQFVKTWNLRPRKPITKPPPVAFNNGGGRGGPRGGAPRASKPRPAATRTRPPRSGAEEKEKAALKRPAFSVSLMKEEIEEDFVKMTGAKPPKKPNQKRPRAVQKRLDACFPGLWLDSVTPQLYRVPEAPVKLKEASREKSSVVVEEQSYSSQVVVKATRHSPLTFTC